jgi:hypothetical protein
MTTTDCVVTQKSAALRRDARQQATPISVRQKSDDKINCKNYEHRTEFN